MKITLDGKLCKHVDAHFAGTKAVGRANSYWCPVGPLPGRAWVLLSRKDVDAVKDQATHTLKFGDTSFGPLYWVKATRLFMGGEGATAAAYLVELADRRFTFERSSIAAQYNVRHHAPPATSGVNRYMETSLDSSALWTWQTMLADMWSNLPGGGTAPTLPYTPHGNPENWHFLGVNAWQAIHEVLHKLLCTTAYDPIGNTLSFVRLGAAQNTTTPANSRLLYSAEPIETDVDIPATVRVNFQTHYLNYGQERDTERTTNWMTDAAAYFVNQATSVSGAVSGTILPLWDDLIAEFGISNTVTNATALSDRAAEIKNNLVQDWQTPQRLRHWQGIANDLLPGERIKAVLWRNYGDGTLTESVEHPGLPKHFDGVMSEERFDAVAEHLAPPDFGRATTPNYPRLTNIVEIFHDETAGTAVEENGDGLHPARVLRWVAGSLATLDDCWLKLLSVAGGVAVEQRRYLARLSGIATSGGNTRPLYVATESPSPSHWHGHLNGFESVTTAEVLEWTEDEVSGSDISHASGVITVARDGIYCFQVNLVASPSGSPFEKVFFDTALRKNGSVFNLLSFATINDNSSPAAGTGYGWTVEAEAGDTFDIQVTASIIGQDFWGSSSASSKRCTFSVHRVN